MEPFLKKKVRTQAEKDVLLKEALAEWHKLGEFQFLVASSDREYVEKIADTIEVEEAAFVPSAPLSPERSEELSAEIATEGLLSRVFGNRAEREEIPTWYQQIHAAEQRADMEKLLGPTRRGLESLDEMVRKSIDRVLQKSGGLSLPSSGLFPRPVASREGLRPLLKAADEFCENTDLSKFLTAFAENNEPAMRSIIREMELEAA